MSIKLDWEFSDAPHDDEARPAPAAPPPPHSSASPKPERASAGPAGRRRRWLWWLAGLAILAAVAGGALWYCTQAGWQRVSDDILAAVRYEDQHAAQGDTALLMAVQDPGNVDWLAVRRDQVAARASAPRPVPVLNPGPVPAALTDLIVLDTEFVEAAVSRQFTTPDGQSLMFLLPQFYRHGTGGDWLRSAPPGSFWGAWLDWRGAHLDIRYSERDAAFVAQVGSLLDARLADACAAWTGGCPNQPPVKLYLSGFVGSLGYNPLSNVEVRIQTDAANVDVTNADGYFLSVPSPQIAGIPSDDTAQAYLTDYLAVRVIASLAKQLSTSPEGYQARTSTAIQALGLANVDPGYLSSGQRQPGVGASFPPPAPIGTPHGQAIQAWRVEVYTTVAGDTLTSIAARFNTPVSIIVQANHLAHPDQLAIGVRLAIPVIALQPAAP